MGKIIIVAVFVIGIFFSIKAWDKLSYKAQQKKFVQFYNRI